jgi:hypothetical protein
LRQSAADRRSNGGVFVVDEACNFKGRHAIEPRGRREILFRGETAEVRFRSKIARQVFAFRSLLI